MPIKGSAGIFSSTLFSLEEGLLLTASCSTLVSCVFCYAGLESSINWFVSSQILKHKNSRLYEASIYEWVNKENNLFIK